MCAALCPRPPLSLLSHRGETKFRHSLPAPIPLYSSASRCCSAAAHAPCRGPPRPPPEQRHAALASPPRAVPWHRAADHQAVPTRICQNRADIVRPRRESTAPSTPHLRPFPGPADHATRFASSPCCSLTTPAPTSATPPAPHRHSSPLDVRRREATTVVSHSPLCCLQSVHLNAGVLRGHFPHCLAPPARRISASGRMVVAAACARRRARAHADSREPTEGLGHPAGSAC
jgi:hypothetical protein